MKIIPSVLLLTCVGFLPSDCDYENLVVRVTMLDDLVFTGKLGEANVQDPEWILYESETKFTEFIVFMRLTHYTQRISGPLRTKVTIQNREYGGTPNKVQLFLRGHEYLEYKPFKPLKYESTLVTQIDQLFVTVPNTKFVYHTILSAVLPKKYQELYKAVTTGDPSLGRRDYYRDGVFSHSSPPRRKSPMRNK